MNKITQITDSCHRCRNCYKFKRDGEDALYVHVCMLTGKVLAVENTPASPFITIPDDCPLPDTELDVTN